MCSWRIRPVPWRRDPLARSLHPCRCCPRGVAHQFGSARDMGALDAQIARYFAVTVAMWFSFVVRVELVAESTIPRTRIMVNSIPSTYLKTKKEILPIRGLPRKKPCPCGAFLISPQDNPRALVEKGHLLKAFPAQPSSGHRRAMQTLRAMRNMEPLAVD